MTGSLILLAGHAGVGKSTLATFLCQANPGWVPLDKDTLTGPLTRAAMTAINGNPHDRETAGYVQQVRPAEYQALCETAIHAASFGATVIATAPWVAQLADRRWVEHLEVDCLVAEVKLHGVWVHCEPCEHRDRIVRRGASRDTAKISDLTTWIHGLSTPSLPNWMTTFDNSVRRTQVEMTHGILRALPDEILWPASR